MYWLPLAAILNFVSPLCWFLWILHASKHVARLRVDVFMLFIAKDIAIIRCLVTSGGHLGFIDTSERKTWKQILAVFTVDICEKNTII